MVSGMGVREREIRADTCLVHAATGHTAAWTVYSLSQHPEVEARLVAELAQHGLLATAMQPTPRPIEWDDIPKLTYLQAVIKVRAAPGKQPKHPCFAAPKGLLAVPIHCTSALRTSRIPFYLGFGLNAICMASCMRTYVTKEIT